MDLDARIGIPQAGNRSHGGATLIGEARLVNGGDFWGRKISVKYDYPSGEVPGLAPPPASYGLETADIVANFDPKRNQLKIDVSEFPGASSTFKACKKTVKLDKLATKDISFCTIGELLLCITIPMTVKLSSVQEVSLQF